ncbi:nicotinate-nucleotide adenylyltransferase [Aquimonas sp.]|jgi:nicotinate-nucleotide adenylyltransferase|uniref:nicotinate-nucleotide adenylyltransferase n=1 Tax=Aquimonas sp. TaxID=1872588 RepID=UPI0037BE6BA4
MTEYSNSLPLHLVYGGTFDPPHRGHLAIASAVRALLLAHGVHGLRFDFLPNADPPHREAPGANAGHRVAMLWLALSQTPGFGIDLREIRRGGASYMVDTLGELRAELGAHAPLVLLMGFDAWCGFDRWQRWQSIPKLAHLLVVDRPDQTTPPPSAALQELERSHRAGVDALQQRPAGAVVTLAVPPHPASASAVRAALASPEPGLANALLEPAVADYIRRHGLYCGPAPESP